MMRIPINKIIDFSVVDGMGSRTSVFVQKCNLRCIYCHNPETINLCNHCGACVPGCPVGALTMGDGRVRWDPDRCIECDACIKICPHSASPRVTWMTVEEIASRVTRNLPFIRGITVSGGESTLYHSALRDLFALLQAQGLSCFLDHNGTFDFRQDPQLLRVTDGVLYDVKATRPAAQRLLTGQAVPQVLDWMEDLFHQGKLEEVRTVIADDPRFDSRTTVAEVAGRLAAMGGREVPYKLLAFRPFGVALAHRSITPPGPWMQEELLAVARKAGHGNTVVIG